MVDRGGWDLRPPIRTNIPHLEGSLGMWRKLYLQEKGDIEKLSAYSRDKLHEVGLPEDYWPIIEALKTWVKNQVPFQVAMLIWRLRMSQEEDGSWRREPNLTASETGCVYRYIQLAHIAGETPYTDPAMWKALKWLEKVMLKDGGFPTYVPSIREDYGYRGGEGETGTTARVVRILGNVLRRSPDLDFVRRMVKKGLEFLRENAYEQGHRVCWKRYRRDEACVVGATALSVIAIVEAGLDDAPLRQLASKALKWILERQNPDGGWSEEAAGKSVLDISYYAVKALLGGVREGVVDKYEALTAVKRAFEWFKMEKPWLNVKEAKRKVYETAFALRMISLLASSGPDDVREEARRMIKPVLSRFLDVIDVTFKAGFDVYYSELTGIALMEFVRNLGIPIYGEEEGKEDVIDEGLKRKMNRLSPIPPAFLRQRIFDRSDNPSELLYLLTPRRLMKLADALVSVDVISSIIGGLVGLLFILNAPPEFVIYIATPHGGLVDWFLWGLALVSNALWLWLKLFTGRKMEKSFDYLISWLITSWYFTQCFGLPFLSPHTLRVIFLYTVLVDVVGWFADRAVLSKVLRG